MLSTTSFHTVITVLSLPCTRLRCFLQPDFHTVIIGKDLVEGGRLRYSARGEFLPNVTKQWVLKTHVLAHTAPSLSFE